MAQVEVGNNSLFGFGQIFSWFTVSFHHGSVKMNWHSVITAITQYFVHFVRNIH